jgi:alanine racemase
VVKADAYGHGIECAVRAFGAAQGLAMLDFVEAVRCREAGWHGPILMLEGFFEPADIELLDRYQLTPVIHNDAQMTWLERASVSRRIDAFVKMNTGMNRLGFAPPAYRRAFERAQALSACGVLGQVGKLTHFANADGIQGVAAQLAEFDAHIAGLPGAISVCNSAATLRYAEVALAHDDLPRWVRPGICLYGDSPFANETAADFGLRPAMTLRSRLISIQEVPAGSTIGYGSQFKTVEPMRVGVVACGYGDGYPRHAADGTPVTVAGRQTRLVGAVSMDMLMVDLTGMPEAGMDSPVVLWGEGGPPVGNVARHSSTIGYELLCAVAPRVPRCYV